MILSASATFDNSVFFISYEPDLLSATSCLVAPGANYLYRVDVSNGDPIANNLDAMNGEEADAAISALHQTQMGGRSLNVNEARPREQRHNRGGGW